MKRNFIFVSLFVLLIFGMVGCTTGGAKLNDGVYTAYWPTVPYTMRTILVVNKGIVTDCEMEEFHNPAFWASLTADEVAKMDPAIYKEITANGRTSYFGKYVTIGTGSEAMKWVASENPIDNGLGTLQFIYSSSQSNNFTDWLRDENNAAWYDKQLSDANYWVTDANGTPFQDLATYTVTFRTGTVIPKNRARYKTQNRHWTAIGTGFGTESGPLGWLGNMEEISKFVVKYQFPQGALSRDRESYIMVGDIVSGATLESGISDYFPCAYKAYAKASKN